MKTTGAEHVLPMFFACSFHGNSMNNLLSYCGLIDAKIRASDKDLPVQGQQPQSRTGTTNSTGMPDFRSNVKEHLQKTKDAMPQGLMREVMETYKPHILSRRRRLIEDCVRDLRLNNDHIHIIEQEMRKAVQVRIKKT